VSAKKRPTLRVDLSKCTGCRACSLACAVSHEQQIDLTRTRIRVHKQMPVERVPVFKPVFCRMCRNARCIVACPSGALYEDEETGLVILDVELCTGCGDCVEACPFEAIWLDEQRGVALKCDLCGGDPACVRFCAPGALSFG
jgi:carbon-monoxide dehydrogenase iron sulfur subunit